MHRCGSGDPLRGHGDAGGHTRRDIAERYVAKNTGTRRYILEYKSGMEELNPWLLDRKGEIYPGDKLTLIYWVKGEEEKE